MLSFFFRLDLGRLLAVWFCIDWVLAAFFVFGIETLRQGRIPLRRRPLGLLPESRSAA